LLAAAVLVLHAAVAEVPAVTYITPMFPMQVELRLQLQLEQVVTQVTTMQAQGYTQQVEPILLLEALI
jgi:hypothetical protein